MSSVSRMSGCGDCCLDFRHLLFLVARLQGCQMPMPIFQKIKKTIPLCPGEKFVNKNGIKHEILGVWVGYPPEPTLYVGVTECVRIELSN